MKRVVKQLLNSLATEPEKWGAVSGYADWSAISKDNVLLRGVGNTKILSILHVEITGAEFIINWLERYRLEGAVLKWYAECDINKLSGDK